jgi:hypothetical protein
MIVYRDQRFRADPRLLLSQLRCTATHFISGSPSSHSDTVETLIDLGKLESGVADALFPDFDGIDPVTLRFRQASSAVGHVLWHTWHQRPHSAGAWWTELSHVLNQLELQPLPRTVEITVPEGYAYYAVYPEMYLEAAAQCHAALGNFAAICLGLRSIGASLSGVVAAALEELGCRVESFTLRPRGEPFSRSPVLSAELEALFRARPQAHFLVIDEGPGISGSSLGGTAAMLHELGIDHDRIILFPGWETDGSHLRSAVARQHWSQHPKFSVSFEELWIQSGRLSRAVPGHLCDFSAGAWRKQLYQDPARYPACHPQHERRKYLLERADVAGREPPKLLSFLGLGEYSSRKLRRADRLAEVGFTPKIETLVHGFAVRRFVPGTPVSANQADSQLVETVAAYLAHLCREHPAEPSVNDSSLVEMISTNVAEGLGEPWLSRLWDRVLPDGGTERPVALDGRMLPHEWIRTSAGYLKTDAIDHHDDHFFPGCQDIAWDVAAASLELGLNTQARRHLVRGYRSLSGDQAIASRLPLYAVAYLAFRLGYAALAASVLGRSPDGDRFAAAARRYTRLLRRELSPGAGERWNV